MLCVKSCRKGEAGQSSQGSHVMETNVRKQEAWRPRGQAGESTLDGNWNTASMEDGAMGKPEQKESWNSDQKGKFPN